MEMENIAKRAVIPEQELTSIIFGGFGDPTNAAAIRFATNSMNELRAALQRYEFIRPRQMKQTIAAPHTARSDTAVK